MFFTDDDNNAPASETRAVLVKCGQVKLGAMRGNVRSFQSRRVVLNARREHHSCCRRLHYARTNKITVVYRVMEGTGGIDDVDCEKFLRYKSGNFISRPHGVRIRKYEYIENRDEPRVKIRENGECATVAFATRMERRGAWKITEETKSSM